MSLFFLTYGFCIAASDQKKPLSPVDKVRSTEFRNNPGRVDNEVFSKSRSINNKPTSQISPNSNTSGGSTKPHKTQTSNQ